MTDWGSTTLKGGYGAFVIASLLLYWIVGRIL